jgi:anti-sigma regulatory factor (Ser/Thr protein kinase)
MERSTLVIDNSIWPVSSTYELPASNSSACLARQLVRGALAEFSPTVIEVAELLVSELVSNAVRHAGGAPIMLIEVDATGVRVAVQDDSPTIPQVQLPSDEAGSGRGLVLVDALAASLGWTKTPEGKRVWFTL